MKTAMQELIEKLSNSIKFEYRNELVNALEKEKEQIIQAINAWCSDDNILTSEQYYNETYNQ
jgi:low affinity Fe/Cu permease